MPNENVFTNRAENYAQGRPGYAPGVWALLFDELLKPGDRIADVGSGTGIFAKEFIDRGFDVYCVEPNPEMRAQAVKALAGSPHFISVDASAENTTLPDQSVDLVTAASAFHWFDAEKFRRECRRVLKRNGIFLAVANGRDYNDPFTQRQHKICVEFCKGFTSLRHGLEKSVPTLKDFLGGGLHWRAFDFPLEYSKDRFIQRSCSSSYAPEPGTGACEKYTRALRSLMDEFAPGSDKMVVPNVSVAFWGEI